MHTNIDPIGGEGIGYGAMEIEHAFLTFVYGQRGDRHFPLDANTFRKGEISELAEVVKIFADKFQTRINAIKWSGSGPGSPRVRVESAIRSLRSLSAQMEAAKGREPEDYHWLIVGDLVWAIGGLLDQMEVSVCTDASHDECHC